MTRDELKAALERLPAGVSAVRIDGPSPYVAVVTSDAFANLDEADRQRAVWSHLRSEFGDNVFEEIEFIFTDTPDERRAATA